MGFDEFELIQRFFRPLARRSRHVALGMGDDAAVLNPCPGEQWVVATDTLVEGVHFRAATAAQDIGFKALMVNLSDLAAMGAEPVAFTLNVTLPEADPQWLQQFAEGLAQAAGETVITLIGGDTTRGARVLTITVFGIVAEGRYRQRGGSRPGDIIAVTGVLGDAALGLAVEGQPELAPNAEVAANLLRALHRPRARLPEGRILGEICSAMIDVSDGLVADLGHLVDAGKVGARLDVGHLPLSADYRQTIALWSAETIRDFWPQSANCPSLHAHWPALCGGDDYELCFTIAAEALPVAARRLRSVGCPVTAIGQITAVPGVCVVGEGGQMFVLEDGGYRHFS